METAVYLGDMQLPVNPASIRYRLPALSAKYELVGAGEAEVLAGARLAEIHIEGFLPAEARHYAQDAQAPGTYIDALRELVEEGQPLRFVYVGEGWDLNMLVSLQTPVFSERGGSMDVDYQIDMRKWSPIEIGLYVGKKGRESSRQSAQVETKGSGDSYTVKAGDSLQRIAKQALGDGGRWREIYAMNKDGIRNPNLIYPGQQLILPETGGGRRSIVSGAATGQKQSAGSDGKGGATTNSAGKSAGSGSESIIGDVMGQGSWSVGANLAPVYNGPRNMVGAYR